ncbi:hypothetical protein Scep_001598 [Stephania cephalantha]|uniref:Uncharacterized protein n=1 Tax=Stephania cephalantha TaxID=152367 RepID=A0AAP0L8A1_9MAGN
MLSTRSSPALRLATSNRSMLLSVHRHCLLAFIGRILSLDAEAPDSNSSSSFVETKSYTKGVVGGDHIEKNPQHI